MEDEAEVMRRVAGGDGAAYALLVAHHLSPIAAYTQRMTGNEALAEDIAQEVFLRLWLKAADFDPARARLTTWLHRMAHNLAIDHLRKRQREAPMGEIDAGEVACHDATDDAAPVLNALMQLPERQRSALTLTYYQDLSNREVADIMGLGTRAVESLLVRARSAMKRILEMTHD
ncbi:MAG: sigma-70 family RNA polymerase sigma factor [Luminiphilus sp.]|nr:sigma-70 family RNA polymerase sigma factor [Luminiphilus sp.]